MTQDICPAKSGLPPRDTIAYILLDLSAIATSLCSTSSKISKLETFIFSTL